MLNSYLMHVKVRRRWWLVLLVSVAICLYGTLNVHGHYSKYENLPWWHWMSERELLEDQSIFSSSNVTTKIYPLNNNNLTKVIMYNNLPFGNRNDHVLEKEICAGKCFVTYDTSYRSVADAVIYHCIELDPMTNVLKRSRPSQLFVFFCMENPWTTLYTRDRTKSFSYFDEVFNLTMTYRTDSDYSASYGNVVDLLNAVNEDPEQKDFDNFLKKKTKLSVWIASNCGFTKGAYHRMQMVKQLQAAGLEIDLFGECFKNKLKTENRSALISKYKFHLSFENALHCRNYITEKVWNNALQAGTVPVIWGPSKDDAARLLPEGSFIMVEDFATPADLVKYLHYLNNDDKAYRKYFEWRNKPTVKSKNPDGLCGLCHSLHTDRFTKTSKVVKSLEEWWYQKESNVCIAPWYHEWSRFRINHFFMQNTRYLLASSAMFSAILFCLYLIYHRHKHWYA